MIIKGDGVGNASVSAEVRLREGNSAEACRFVLRVTVGSGSQQQSAELNLDEAESWLALMLSKVRLTRENVS